MNEFSTSHSAVIFFFNTKKLKCSFSDHYIPISMEDSKCYTNALLA